MLLWLWLLCPVQQCLLHCTSRPGDRDRERYDDDDDIDYDDMEKHEFGFDLDADHIVLGSIGV